MSEEIHCQEWIDLAVDRFLGQSGVSVADVCAFLEGVPEKCHAAIQRVLSRIEIANTAETDDDRWPTEYERIGVLGKGGMGFVYLVRPLASETQLALKIPHSSSDPRFAAEIWNHILIPPHDCLVMWNYIRQFEDCPCILMEYMDGGSLANLIHESSWDSAEQWLRDFFDVAIQCSWAIRHLHAHRLIHQDIKPENILFRSGDSGYRVGLADFGVSSFRDDGNDSVVVIGATRKYAAPEQLQDGKADEKSDVYSLGTVLLAMLDACPGADEDSNQIRTLISEMTQAVPEQRPTVDSLIETLIQLHSALIGDTYHLQSPVLEDSEELSQSILEELKQPSSIFYDVARLWSMDTGHEKQLAAIRQFYMDLLQRVDNPVLAARMSLLIQIIFLRAANDGQLIQLDELERISVYTESFLARYNDVELPTTYATEFREAACPMLIILREWAVQNAVLEIDRIKKLMGCNE